MIQTISKFALSILASLILAKALSAQDPYPVGYLNFKPRITNELREGFEKFEEQDKRSYEMQHGEDFPIKYPEYRTNPPSIVGPITSESLDKALADLKISNPSAEQRRDLIAAYSLARILPAQMRALDKHMRIRPVRLRYARDTLYELVGRLGTTNSVVSESRAQYATLQIFRSVQIQEGLEKNQPITASQLCNFITSGTDIIIRIDWTDESDPYSFPVSEEYHEITLKGFNCNTQLPIDKLTDQLYQNVQRELQSRMDSQKQESHFDEAVWFYLKRFKSFTVNFDSMSPDMFREYHKAELEGWAPVIIDVPVPPKNELELLEVIYDGLNPVYLRDIFRAATVQYGEALGSEGRERLRKANAEYRDVKIYYDNDVSQRPLEKRRMKFEVQSVLIPYADASFDEQVDAIFSDEFQNTVKKLQNELASLLSESENLDTLQKLNRDEKIRSIKADAFKKFANSLASRLNASEATIVWDKPQSLSGTWDEILPNIKGRAWEDFLTKQLTKFKSSQKRSLFPVETSLSEGPQGFRYLRLGFLASFEVPGLYELQLELQDELTKKRQEDFFSWSLNELMKNSTRYMGLGPSAWHQCLVDLGNQPNEVLNEQNLSRVFDMAIALYHLETKKAAHPEQRGAHLFDDFIPRQKH